MNLKKELFELLESIGEGVREEGFHIYMADSGGGEWRCDMGKLGSFIVYRYESYEDYDSELDDWVTVREAFYSYLDMNELFEDYPKLPIEKALDHIKKYLEKESK